MKVRIYNPTKTAMQSGKANTKFWLLVPVEEERTRSINYLTGWTSTNNTAMQLKLKFKTKEDAVEYAKSNNYQYEIDEPEEATIKKKSYAENFTAPILN